MKNNHLQRFMEAQTPVYDGVVQELRNAKKVSHWMWYIFPQIKGLGLSSTSHYYGINNLDEAVLYLNHPILGQRLLACCDILLSYQNKSAEQIFGNIDSIKLQSSMTLFAQAYCQNFPQLDSDKNVFLKVLDQYFHGEQDQKTLDLLAD